MLAQSCDNLSGTAGLGPVGGTEGYLALCGNRTCHEVPAEYQHNASDDLISKRLGGCLDCLRHDYLYNILVMDTYST